MGFLVFGAEAPLRREGDADRVGHGLAAADEGADLAAVRAFMGGARVAAQAAGDVGADLRAGFFRRIWRRRRRWWRRFVRTGAGQVLAGNAVVVAVEPVGVARQEVFLGFGLVREVGAVVIERRRFGRRGKPRDRDRGGDANQ